MGYMEQEKTYLKRVNEKSIRVACRCGVEYTQPFGDFVPEYIEEFGQYQNFNAECPECKEVTVFNLNIPITAAEDVPEEPFFPEHERQQREPLRALLWKLRPDLNEAEREAVEIEKRAEMESLYNADIETIRDMYKRELDLLAGYTE